MIRRKRSVSVSWRTCTPTSEYWRDTGPGVLGSPPGVVLPAGARHRRAVQLAWRLVGNIQHVHRHRGYERPLCPLTPVSVGSRKLFGTSSSSEQNGRWFILFTVPIPACAWSKQPVGLAVRFYCPMPVVVRNSASASWCSRLLAHHVVSLARLMHRKRSMSHL